MNPAPLAAMAVIAGRSAAAATVLLLLASCSLAPQGQPPRFGRLPDFTLVDQLGHPVTLAGLKGKIWVADFIFTRCAGSCPAMTARMARLRRDVPEAVAFTSFSVDPSHDTPAVLSRYGLSFNAAPNWSFVTGPQKDLYALSTGGFKLAAMEVPPEEQKGGGDGPFLHSTKFVLVDKTGEIRGYYDSTDEEAMKSLVADVARLQPEPAS